jgi:hypothetical protein
VALAAIVFGVFSLVRLAALSYVAVYFGQFTSRIIFSIYAVAILLALPFVADTLHSLRGTPSGNPRS